MTKYNLRYATKKDFDFFFKGEKLLYSSRAWVLCKKRQRFAIGGIWLMKTQNTAFVRVKENLPKKEFWKTSKLVTEELLKLNIPIICFRDSEQINSKKYLEKLGYKQSGMLNNQEIYKL